LLQVTKKYITITISFFVTLHGSVCTQMSGEVDSSNAHCSALVVVATCQN